jgi:cytochrome c553
MERRPEGRRGHDLIAVMRLARFIAVAMWVATSASAQTVAKDKPVEDTIAQRLLACTGCHGERGAGVVDSAFPRLAGQPVDYLFSQLRAFRDGVRTYAPMNFLLARQSDAYLREMATYFAAQSQDPRVVDARIGKPVDRAAFEAGRALVHEGRAAGDVPACVACHGSTMMGTLPAIPALAGLPRDLLIEQIGSWKTGGHRSPEPNCMAKVASRMSGGDIVAAATWLSLQQPSGVPEAPHEPLPIACGRAP